MDELPLLYQQSPGLQQINLEFSEIESLDPILPILSQFSDLRELLLFGNRLETLPKDLSKLKTLEKLDISNNLIESVELILPGLSSLPNLIELHITLQTENDEEVLIKSLSKLINLNGSQVDRSKYENKYEEHLRNSSQFENSRDFEESPYENQIDEEENENESSKDQINTLLACESSGYFGEEASLNQEYLEKVAILYDSIRLIWQKEEKSMDKKLAETFDEGIKSIMADLSAQLKSNHSDFQISLNSIKAKFELALICKSGLHSFIQKKIPSVSNLLNEINAITESLFKDLLNSLSGIQPKIEKKLGNLKAELDFTANENNEVILAAEQIEKEAKMHRQEKENLIRRFQEERQELLEEIESLKEENKKYLETIVRHSKNYAESHENSKGTYENSKSLGENPKKLHGEVSCKSMDEDKSYSLHATANKMNGKLLSVRQLKEIIEEIYASKAKYDERCADGKMPRETMEQHMYTYLNTKYGLKNLILEWASSILTSIKKHSSKDNDIAVFGKIIRNECDEEFKFVQIQVKETVAELLKMHLKNKFPLKTANDITDMVNERINGFLLEEEWGEIVKYMYNEEDSIVLSDDIFKIIRKKEHLNALPMPKGKISREEAIILKEKEKSMKNRILYDDFLKVLLDFQLKGHEKFLAKFVQIFRRVDTDSDGIINESEFRSLVLEMDLGFSEDDIVRLLQIIDPYNNQQITFSEGVALFSTELIPVEGVAVMKKLSLED